MLLLPYTRKKISSVIALIRLLKESDFPHPYSKQALEEIEKIFDLRLQSLDNISDTTDSSVTKALCKEGLAKIWLLLPFLGFIIRSADVRNAFELHGPFLRLTHQALGDDAKLIISSEWDFSPFTFLMPPDLAKHQFVMIGIPATESSNSLVIPLAGHELGHNVWKAADYETSYEDKIEDFIPNYIKTKEWANFQKYFPNVKTQKDLDDLLGRSYWKISWDWAKAQCEELFCDFVGLYLFKESYLHAFAYLLAPGLQTTRAETYPGLLSRIAAHIETAKEYQIAVPDGYKELFYDDLLPTEEVHRFLLSLSDAATKALQLDLAADAKNFVKSKGLDNYSPEKVRSVIASLKRAVPASNANSLANIISAGWEFSSCHQQEWAKEYPAVAGNPTKCNEVLNELILKSIEIFEIEQLQSAK